MLLCQIMLMRTRFLLLRRFQWWQQVAACRLDTNADYVDAVLHWTLKSLQNVLRRLQDPMSPGSTSSKSNEFSGPVNTNSSISGHSHSIQQDTDRESLHNTWAVLHHTFSCLTTRLHQWRVFSRANQLRELRNRPTI